MAFRPWLALPIALAALLLPQAARAENPKVTLVLQDVDIMEAVTRLSKASSVPMEIYSGQTGGLKLNFNWKETPLAQCMRQLCEKADLRPTRTQNGFGFYAGNGAPAPPLKPVGLVEKNGVRLYARSASIEERRTRVFNGEGATNDESRLQLQLFGELGEGDSDAVAGIENLTARDDQGTVLTCDASRTYAGAYYAAQYPDEWGGNYAFTPPSPKARVLKSVEGDLMMYRQVQSLKVEIPLPLTTPSVRKEVGDWLLVVSQYNPEYKEPEDDDAGLPMLTARTGAVGPYMRVRIYYPNRSTVTSRTGWSQYPVLVGASGRQYNPMPLRGHGAGNGELTLTDAQLVFPSGKDTPAKLVWNLVVRSQPYRLFSFRMTDIPLPQASTFVPQGPRPPSASRVSLGFGHPYYQRDGGVLVTKVLLGDKPADEGKVQVGLAQKTAAGYGPVRWIEVDVDPDGEARVLDLKPGTYRVVRSYFSEAKPGAKPAEGEWQETKVEVTVAAGKETVPAALRRGAGK